MNREEKAMLTTLVGAAIVLMMALNLAVIWLAWAAGVLVVVLAAIMLGRRHWRHRREEQQLWQQQYEQQRPPLSEMPVQPPPPASYSLENIPLASADADYRFIFSGTVFWCPLQAHNALQANLDELAATSILARAQEFAGTKSPIAHAFLQHQLAAALSVALPDSSHQVQVWASDIRLAIPDDDAQRLGKLAELRKQEQVWEQERGLERNVRAYLGKDVLTSTGSAVVWWLARHTDQVEQAVQLIDTLEQLTAAANITEVPNLFRPVAAPTQRESHESAYQQLPLLVPAAFSTGNGLSDTINLGRNTPDKDPAVDLADQVYPGPDDPRRALFGHGLAEFVAKHNACDLAERIRHQFDLTDLDTPTEPDPTDDTDAPSQPETPDQQ